MSRHDQIRMDLIGYHQHMMLQTDICQPVQHFHLAEKDEQITFFDSQVSGDFVDDGVLGLF